MAKKTTANEITTENKIITNEETTVLLQENKPKTLKEKLGITNFVISGLKVRKIRSILNNYQFLSEKLEALRNFSATEEDMKKSKIEMAKSTVPIALQNLTNEIEAKKISGEDSSAQEMAIEMINKMTEKGTDEDYLTLSESFQLNLEPKKDKEIKETINELDALFEQVIIQMLFVLGVNTAKKDELSALEIDNLVESVINEKENNLPDYFTKMLMN